MSEQLEDLLSLDEVVMDGIQNTLRPCRRRLPTLLLTHLLSDLHDLIMEYAADNVKTIRYLFNLHMTSFTSFVFQILK